MQDDLKNYRADNGFVLLSEGEALTALILLVFGVLILDRLGVWA